MSVRFSRAELQRRIGEAFSSPGKLATVLTATDTTVPPSIVDWITRLMLLYGVPFPYLVPDERMLPPESIRFFCLNQNWVSALVDGALSLGRNLTSATSAAASSPAGTVDRVLLPKVRDRARAAAAMPRARKLGLAAAPDVTLDAVSGFLLRSSAVGAYPTMAVDAYPDGVDPTDPANRLPVLRFDRLGPASDTLLFLVSGDAVQYNIYEPPMTLHYGFDDWSWSQSAGVSAHKAIHTFTRGSTGQPVTLSTQTPSATDVSACFRQAYPRTAMLAALGAAIASANAGMSWITSAEMGFEMTEGVGQVSFKQVGTGGGSGVSARREGSAP